MLFGRDWGSLFECWQLYSSWSSVLAGFHLNADASHQSMGSDFRGNAGIGVFAFGTLLLARSFVQDQVLASACESEYCMFSSAVKDLQYVWLFATGSSAPPPTMLVDSEPAIVFFQDSTPRSRTEHIDFTKACDYVHREWVVMEHCSYWWADFQYVDQAAWSMSLCCLQGPHSFLACIVFVVLLNCVLLLPHWGGAQSLRMVVWVSGSTRSDPRQI